jgi:hypothetical protein
MPQGWATFVGAPALSALTGLQRLELRSERLPPDTLLHLAPLTRLTHLSVECDTSLEAPPPAGSVSGQGRQPATSALLSHVGALAGLTRLSKLTLREVSHFTEDYLEAQPLEALLAALPSAPSLTKVGRQACGAAGAGWD